MSQFEPPTEPSCPYCLDFGIGPLQDIPGRTDWAICLCRAGKRWRYGEQLDKRGRAHTVPPHWKLWAAEWGIAIGRERVTDAPACVDLIEKWYPRETIAELFELKRGAA